MGEHMVANHPNLASVSYMSAASSDLFFAVQQGLQVNTGLYPNMASVSYMSAASSDLFFAVQQGLQVLGNLHPSSVSVSYLLRCSAGPSGKYSSLSQYGVCQLHVSCQETYLFEIEVN